MPAKSKSKGNTNERKIAKILSRWCGDEFLRIPNSGALRWKGKAWVYGDLLPPPDFPLCVFEAKHYRDVDLDKILRVGVAEDNVLGWWQQVCLDSQRCTNETGWDPMPVLVFKANHRPFRICLLRSFCSLLPELPMLQVTGTELPDFCIIDLDEFMKKVPYDLFCESYTSFASSRG